MFLQVIGNFVLAYLWPTVWTTMLIGIPLVFYLGLVWGKQAGYVGRLILHPIRLAQGEWLCPQCYGSAHDGDHTCYFCLQDFMTYGTVGLVKRKRLFKDWQWRRWTLVSPNFYPVPPSLQPKDKQPFTPQT